MPTLFKLKFRGLTRRVSFAKQPDWQELSNKISGLYCIPQHRVGVTYIDAENEEITLNTEGELQDYYFSSYSLGDTIKFSIQDLTSRNQVQVVSASAGHRNTFGQFIDPEILGIDDWQAINSPPPEEIIGHSSVGSDVRSAFVESTASDGDTAGKGADNTFGVQVGTTIEGTHSEVSEKRISNEEKGKKRAHSVSSSQSLLAGDKHPVHRGGDVVTTESTLEVLEQDVPVIEKEFDRMREFEDPPLPSLEPGDLHTVGNSQSSQSAEDAASASLAQDITSFLSTVSIVISAHPELGDSLRTIVRNVTNGTYWVSHREALSQAAAELQRNTENFAEDSRRVVEEEAGRRVTQALSGVLRIFSQSQDEAPNVQTDRNAQMPKQATEKDTRQVDTANVPPMHDANPELIDPSRPQIPPISGASTTASFGTYFGGRFPFSQGPRSTWHRQWRARAPIPPNFPANGRKRFPAQTLPNSPFGTGTAPFSRNAFELNPGLGPIHKPESSASIERQQLSSTEESKTKVKEAKRIYKGEKERYRRERDEEKDNQKTVKSTGG